MTLPFAQTRSNSSIARIGSTHGYRLDGDLAHLNAEVVCDEAALSDLEWALQLWANDSIKIAELPIGLLLPNGSGLICISGSTTLLPPAGNGEYSLSLALVSATTGDFDTLEDSAAFVQTVSFVQPRVRGEVTCEFSGDEICLKLNAIENPRATDNISGTLALEVWSLDAPYTGGLWSGQPLASVVLGSLNGQSEWADCSFITHAAPLPAEGYLTLMLREWTPAGYVTRDFRALSECVAEPVAAPAAEEAAKPAGKTKKGAAKAKKAPAKGKAAKVKPAAKTAEAAPAKPVAAKSAAVSVNQASAAELTAVKGLSASLAKAIIAGRPYATLDELTKAKGMGPKLLAKVLGDLTV